MKEGREIAYELCSKVMEEWKIIWIEFGLCMNDIQLINIFSA